jgi:hypothetical protein
MQCRGVVSWADRLPTIPIASSMPFQLSFLKALVLGFLGFRDPCCDSPRFYDDTAFLQWFCFSLHMEVCSRFPPCCFSHLTFTPAHVYLSLPSPGPQQPKKKLGWLQRLQRLGTTTLVGSPSPWNRVSSCYTQLRVRLEPPRTHSSSLLSLSDCFPSFRVSNLKRSDSSQESF